MITIRKWALVLCLASLSMPCSSQLQDDGYTGVNLNFAFPYYDKTFNSAYMYDNGVVSFIEPGQPNALSPWQWNSQPLSQTQAKYFIAPLWADIAPVPQTTYQITQTATSAKFAWNNIAEYYSRGGILRLNSFSVEINKDGEIATKYYGLNLRTSNISIGLRGDTDYTQIAYNPYGYVLSSQADWTANTKVAPAPIPTPIKQEPDPVIETVSNPVQETQPVQNTVQNPVQNNVQNITQNTPTAVQAVTPVVVAEPVKTTEKKVAVVKSTSTETAVVDAAIAIAMQSASQSVNEQVVVSNSFSLSNSNVINNRQTSQMTSQRQTTEQVDSAQQSVGNSDKKDAMDMVLLNNLEKQETRQDQKDKGINKSVVANLELGQQLPLVDLLVLQDAPFYAPKAIYRNQRVVDNSRLLRSLSSDKRYEDLINIQYQR